MEMIVGCVIIGTCVVVTVVGHVSVSCAWPKVQYNDHHSKNHRHNTFVTVDDDDDDLTTGTNVIMVMLFPAAEKESIKNLFMSNPCTYMEMTTNT
jgi:hypothetical protein